MDDHFPGTLFLAEANMWPEDSAAYFGDGDECQMNYHFPIMPRMFILLQMEDKYPLIDISLNKRSPFLTIVSGDFSPES